ncbi:LysM domain receptor-like kinase 4 [Acorus calamus]|uniref:LysM domain receptor-like kinase 4 n=1 Tax=Acorus calamus TaxID=4465 RepID=A0AAV9FAJ5_ACOCL|nr:LysM domain receptor-like kinase 4 [Acorus calamus]
MRATIEILLPLTTLLLILQPSQAQGPPSGYNCSSDRTIYPCRTYAIYRATAPNLLNLASIGDLFGLSRFIIAEPSNITYPNATLVQDQLLLIPLTCSCSSPSNHSYYNVTYKMNAGDTFYILSTTKYQNLTVYQDVELVNPTLVPTNIPIGQDIVIPVFCQCPEKNLTSQGINYLLSYQFRPSDNNASSVASRFGADVKTMTSVNPRGFVPYSTVLVPVSKLPVLPQDNNTGSSPPTNSSGGGSNKDGVVVGLSIGLGVLGMVLIVGLFWFFCFYARRVRRRGYGEAGKKEAAKVGRYSVADEENNFMADIADCLDRYKLYQMEELRRATSDFDPTCVIEGSSVYKGFINGEAFAIKKMKWNAYQELKILQKVNHTNLVKLEGFCIDPEDGTCYLVYEFIENGSLSTCLHQEGKASKLDWKTRLRIAFDVANGLQYIHEHTFPRGYIAPEYLVDGLVTTKMDVFAYGVVLLELMSGREAINDEGELLWMEVERVFERVEGVEGEEAIKSWMDAALVEEGYPVESVMSVMGVARACVQKDPAKRPSMVDVAYTLSKADDAFSDFSGDGVAVDSSGVVGR